MPRAHSLQYRERPPAKPLRPWIECVWAVWDPRRRTDRPVEHIVPDGCPELIVHSGDRFARWAEGRWVLQPRTFLAGTLSRPWSLRAGARVRTLGIRFRPGAAAGFFRCSMQDSADREVPLATLVGAQRASALERSVTRATSACARLLAADTWLLAHRATPPGPQPAVTRPAIEMILRARGEKRIADIAARLGVGRRRLERGFARELGIRPKLFARIVRLNAALALLGRHERGRAVDIALAAGYFDQAHMSRDFRAVAGRRAGEPRDRDGDLAPHFTHPDRLLALLAGE